MRFSISLYDGVALMPVLGSREQSDGPTDEMARTHVQERLEILDTNADGMGLWRLQKPTKRRRGIALTPEEMIKLRKELGGDGMAAGRR